MKNQILLVIAILCSFISTGVQAQGPTVHTADMIGTKLPPPTKNDIEREIKRYRTLYGEAEKRNLGLDASVVGVWTSSANSLEAGMSMNPDEFRNATLAGSYQTVRAFNTSVERNLNDADRILVMECCHNIKDGKVCKSLPDGRKKDLDKCQKAHK